eukprot:CAMPEP_0115834846 /NCGR_PEP_ID=MMETSP0287-20121206/3892_1 /TAXON_ID=412157 /ORGANISM="Chrysochromulina rotalis, Strain UIO044" /LENGTH=80 /DNA_ID=CAMNT_0003288291 /DNA_START=145 /DNA_END=387 /DNA_ORIENTATION=-
MSSSLLSECSQAYKVQTRHARPLRQKIRSTRDGAEFVLRLPPPPRKEEGRSGLVRDVAHSGDAWQASLQLSLAPRRASIP